MGKAKLTILKEMSQKLDKQIADEVASVAEELWKSVPSGLIRWREATFETFENFVQWLTKITADQYNPKIEPKPVVRIIHFSRSCLREDEPYDGVAKRLFEALAQNWSPYFTLKLGDLNENPPSISLEVRF